MHNTVKIVSDTSTLFDVESGKKLGIQIAPLSITINNKTYIEFSEISSKELCELINEGHFPTSSQPAIGEFVDIYNENETEDVLVITMGEGISGTYNSACAANNLVDNSTHIEVYNSKTLCGPQRYMAIKASELANEGKSMLDILEMLNFLSSNTKSFLIPNDFDFLKRGGRLTPLAATMGSLLKLVPVLKLTTDGKRLEKFSINRTFKKALSGICDSFLEDNLNEDYIIYVSHANNENLAIQAKSIIEKFLPHCEICIQELSPVFVTHGGPSCVSVQYIKKYN